MALLAGAASAQSHPAPRVDVRERLALPAQPSAEVRAAADALRRRLPDVRIQHSARTSGASRVVGLFEPLTPASPRPATEIAAQFVNDNRVLFGLQANDLSELRVEREFQSRGSGTTHVTLQQQLHGVDVYGCVLKLSITSDGRVLFAAGEPLPNLHRYRPSADPTIAGEEAVQAAASSAGVHNLYSSTVNGLVYFAVAIDDLRLAWDVVIEDGDTPFVYQSLVDAHTGAILFQVNTTAMDHFPAHGSVYTNDGPQPSTPTSTISGLVPRDDVDFSGQGFFPHDDPHYDWWDGGPRTTTTSNNVIAREDRDGNNEATLGFQPTANPGEDFTFSLDLTADPGVEDMTTQNQSAAIVNLFHRNNWLHDVLYRLGFDENGANFQTDNFGLGGDGGDPVRADAQDRADKINMPNPGDNLCNAFFNGCQDDGDNPRMTMLLCDRDSPLIDVSLDNSVIAHEYGHGVHHRLVPSTCMRGHQGMGEGWGDYLAVALLAEPDDDITGQFGVGHWLANSTGKGLRRQPYTIDQSVFTRTYASITDGAKCALGVCSGNTKACDEDSDCPAMETCGAKPSCSFHTDCDAPPQAFDLGDCAPETHKTGELWAETLWLARANLVIKYGFGVGGLTINKLVIEGMKMTAPYPSFLDARDGVLLADLAENGGANQCLLWDAFARMGMGLSALTIDENDINPVEGFDTPPACTPNIDVSGDLDFGNVCLDETSANQLEVFNTGTGDLIVTSISRSSGSDNITLSEIPEIPLAIAGGSHVGFTVLCAGNDRGVKTATFRIKSNDPDQPRLDLEYTCTTPRPDLNLSIADSGAFGEVCAGEFADLDLTLFNQGACDLTIDSISVDNPQFLLPDDTTFPLVLSPDADFNLPIRFAPHACGDVPIVGELAVPTDEFLFADSFESGGLSAWGSGKNATAGGENARLKDAMIELSGTSPCPDLNVAIANSGNFGNVCKSEHADLDLTLFNQGKCNLSISDIELLPDPDSFELPDHLTLPLVLSPDADFNLPVRFAPEECIDAPETRTLKITSDDPDEMMVNVDISGESQCPSLVIDPPELTALFAFPATVVDTASNLGCFSERSLNLRNAGGCPLTVEGITAAGADFTVTAPSVFPVLLPAGQETLSVTVRFTPKADADPLAPSEVTGTLTVESDDPGSPHEAGLCGESAAQSGARILVTDISSATPVPIDEVDVITVSSKGIHEPGPINLRFTDQPLTTAMVCGNEVAYHVDLETLPSTDTTGSNPNSSYEASAKEGNLQNSESFGLNQCELREFQLQLRN